MDYKKLIKNQETRLKILKLLDFIPDKLMVKLQYRIKTGRRLNLKTPTRFTEKLQWYKLNYRDSLMTQCADKYGVREYVAQKGFADILVPLYGVYDSAEEIDFDALPSKFVLKTTNASHTNIICEDKEKLDLTETKKLLHQWLNKRPVKAGREWAYYNIKPRIICEQYLEDKSNNFSGINDYKFICFSGNVKYLWVDVDRYTNHKRNFYDINWKYHDVISDCLTCGDIIPKPEGLNEMVEIANKLSSEFPHVRVDLYWINNKVYFGELTFYLLSGYEKLYPDEFDYILGRQFQLPKIIER